MSTRCHIIVEDSEYDSSVILYRHSDGYPEFPGVVPDLAEFLAKFMKQRGWDPYFLPAQLIHFMIAKSSAHMLETYQRCLKDNPDDNYYKTRVENGGNDFLGYGISSEIHGDVEYIYLITKEGVNVYKIPWDVGNDRSKWEKLTNKTQAKMILEGRIPKKWK